MKHDSKLGDLVLSVYATSHGVAYVLFAGFKDLRDWRSTEIRQEPKNASALAKIIRIINRYQPKTLVIEDYLEDGSPRRIPRICNLYEALVELAQARQITVCQISNNAVHEYFACHEASTKHEIACVIVGFVPAFAVRLPPKRKPWMSEDRRQGLFDAAALGMTYYRQQHNS